MFGKEEDEEDIGPYPVNEDNIVTYNKANVKAYNASIDKLKEAGLPLPHNLLPSSDEHDDYSKLRDAIDFGEDQQQIIMLFLVAFGKYAVLPGE